jgi:two-component system response regulator YesN
MKKIIIADDELLVRVGLKSTINWQENGFIIVGEAKNGKEAIQLFEEHDPDILLTDIRMPIIDGLELIQILKSKKKSLKAVILTHYDDFNYAKEAITLGASEYILKSDLSSENLIAILKKLSAEIDDENARLNKSAKVGPFEKKTYIPNIETELKKIVMGNYKSTEELDFIVNGTAKISQILRYNSFVVASVIMHIEDIKDKSCENDNELLKKAIENIAKDIFNERHITHFTFINKNNIVYLFNIDEMYNSYEIIENISNLLILFKKSMQQILDIDIIIGLSDVGNSIEKIPSLFKQSKIAQKYCFFESSGVVTYNDSMLMQTGPCPKINSAVLKNYIMTFDINQLDNYIGSIFDELYNLKQIDYVRNVFIDFLSQAKFIAAELKLKNGPALNELKLSYTNFESLYSFEMVKKYIIDIYHELVNYTGDSKLGHYSYIITKAIEYIKNNYQKNITLEEVAEYVQISKSYLSLLFKQETGINFSNFLTNYRIEKSKPLLRETNLKIYEIAEKVGFDNPYYYSKVFKDVTGMTCKEFKR